MTAATCRELLESASPRFGNSHEKPGPSSGAEMLNDDYKEMLQCLSEERVEFLLVGAYALAVHGYPRATKQRTSPPRASSFRLAIAPAASTSSRPSMA
jgi:hypothetical protein